jgi:hypothetical protein
MGGTSPAYQAVDEARGNVNPRIDERDTLMTEAGARIAESHAALDDWLPQITGPQEDAGSATAVPSGS